MRAILFACAVASAALLAACRTTYFETPTSSTATTVAPDLSTLTSRVARGGVVSRSFTMASAGTIQLTLTSADPAVPLGVGVGIPRSDCGGCDLTRSTETMPDAQPQVALSADAGQYCVKVFDTGLVVDAVSFSVTITHP